MAACLCLGGEAVRTRTDPPQLDLSFLYGVPVKTDSYLTANSTLQFDIGKLTGKLRGAGALGEMLIGQVGTD